MFEMKKIHPGLVLAIFLSTFFFVESQAYSSDASVMFALRNSLNPLEVLGWSDPDPCYWSHVSCTAYKRVAWIQIGGLNLTGSLPDLSGLTSLVYFNIRDNKLAGLVPLSLLSLPSLKIVNLTNNLLQGPTPKFSDSVAVDMNNGSNRFCLPTPGDECDPRVNTFLSIARSVDYPTWLADAWKGNDPCSSFWVGITCVGGNVTVINFSKMGLSGTISPDFSSFKSLKILILANNNLTGVIPKILTTLPMLRELDLSNNQLSGKVPKFRSNVKVNVNGNPNVGKDKGNSTSVAMPTADSPVPSTDKIQELAVIPRM